MTTPLGPHPIRALFGAALALGAAAGLACSFSYSSESSSDSSKHSSDSSTSSSDSSAPGDHDHDNDKDTSSFAKDVEQYTAAFLAAGGTDQEAFLAGIGDLARQNGVSDWEADASTWEAIGRGLARSHATPAQRTAYQAAWTGGDATKKSAVAKGISTVQ